MLNWIVLNRADYLHKMDLALNNLQMLICHKTQQTNQPTKTDRGPQGTPHQLITAKDFNLLPF